MVEAASRRDVVRMAGLGLGALAVPGAAWAAQAAEDPLDYVDPELRPLAKLWLKMQQSKTEMPPAPLPPIPAGVEKQVVPGRNGAPPVTLYVINAQPKGAPATGGILHTHGGGFIYRSALEDLARLKMLAERIGCVIVTVEYRLAPGTHFPGSLEDNYAGLKWMADNAAAIGVDPARIALMGESAGGGHAAILAIAARDRGGIKPAFQALIYPMLDDRTGSTRRVPPHIGTIVWTAADNRKGWGAFLGQPAGRPTVPAGSVPARVTNLAGLPPAFIAVGGIDLFVDEDIAYAGRLTDAGVATELLVLPNAYHAFDLAMPQARVSRQFQAAFDAALTRALGLKKAA
jgi:acetyl esterase/lipase